MKLTLGLLVALVATVLPTSAAPIRIINLSSGEITTVQSFDTPPPNLLRIPVSSEDTHNEGDDAIRFQPMPFRRPCPNHRIPSGPLGSLLAKFGLGPSPSRWEQVAKEVHAHSRPEGGMMAKMSEGWRAHVEDMVRQAQDKVVPIMEGGGVKILPFVPEQRGKDKMMNNGQGLEGHDGWHKKHGHGYGHMHGHHHAPTFSGRLHRALHHLSPAEAIAMAFVLGAGLGSILHFFFMLFLLSLRRLRGGCKSREERRAARAERRALRKARKAGRVALPVTPIEEGEEVLPAYGDVETDNLVEKA
ncbi:hypothetical protein TREMEDRAFT_70870 [Tremella mesenterica DSM 1558]|uniref:uncharacterized protein n=1 Tax=Tremella mesenterica (strain ATCC 24925 / CBS 8224 / DSM 1558 / NBRC 9311 / NRRL Y-6157 / RJB 2259-6 / UBC 559-6) TaxID=578456 RepID=UPI0003F49AA8|nr:uncharacterized protein TREMEDRAFT_70870 [Tremella mesenterica DSM 1558]EIW72960.1 hypothetical protein TREMEDRAFT_70870 [Tremella mesenterica DSM 1558]